MKNGKLKSALFAIVYTAGAICLLSSCDNRQEIEDYRKEKRNETNKIENLKYSYEKSIDSLNSEIEKINKSKSELQKDKKYSEAQIYSILNNSYFDHIIIGTTDLSSAEDFYSGKLGFSIKKGRKHKNGIMNFYIEFKDRTEIEIISVESPKDKIAEKYNQMIKMNSPGLQFALRTNKLSELYGHLTNLNEEYSEFTENSQYSILAKREIDEEFPIFFIDYKGVINSTLYDHANSTEGIGAVWFETKNLKKSIFDFTDVGFGLIDTIRIGNLSNKAVIMRNDNFDIILIENSRYAVSGISIKTKSIDMIKNRLNKFNIEYEDYTNKLGRNILLNPEVTNSLWIEFSQK